MVGHHAHGGVEAEQVVHGGGQLERAFVAVALDACQPLGVDHARAHHPCHLFGQGAHPHRAGHAEVAVVQGGQRARQQLHRGPHAAVELVVVVGIQDVVLAVVLVVQHGLQATQALLERATRRQAVPVLPVGKGPGMQVSLRQVGAALPAATHDLFLHTRPIAAGARPEHPPGGVPPGLVFGLPLRNGLRHVALHPHADGVDVVRLVVGRHGGHGLHGGVEQVDEVGEGVAEKA